LSLLPLGTLFDRYRRAVRDLAKEQDKEVTLDVTGADVEVDKRVIDQLAQVLLHLLRNAVDHGIELPDDRARRGKPRAATISLSAKEVGPQLQVTVGDDGRGLSADAIRRTAVTRGICSAEQAQEIGHEELLQLLFTPGFSTRADVTDISGRGIGLDVVKRSIERLGGAIHLDSTPGHGTTFVLLLPLDLAITRAVILDFDDQYFAIPTHAIDVTRDIRDEDVEQTGARQTARIEGNVVPLVDLSTLLGRPSTDVPKNGTRRVVVIRHQGRSVGICVGRLLGEREFMRRPPGPFLEGSTLVAGTALLEHGRIVMALSIPGLIAHAIKLFGTSPVGVAAPTRERKRVVLLVDDSELVRDMVRPIIAQMGCGVLEAVNGQVGLDLVNQEQPDLVITDLEMPVMNGFELIENVRQTSNAPTVPMVVMSTRGSAEDRAKAAELGADAYLVKSEFREEAIVELVRRFIGSRPRMPS
jgi:two-component system chemotaxis sensor kinase CheA